MDVPGGTEEYMERFEEALERLHEAAERHVEEAGADAALAEAYDLLENFCEVWSEYDWGEGKEELVDGVAGEALYSAAHPEEDEQFQHHGTVSTLWEQWYGYEDIEEMLHVLKNEDRPNLSESLDFNPGWKVHHTIMWARREQFSTTLKSVEVYEAASKLIEDLEREMRERRAPSGVGE